MPQAATNLPPENNSLAVFNNANIEDTDGEDSDDDDDDISGNLEGGAAV